MPHAFSFPVYSLVANVLVAPVLDLVMVLGLLASVLSLLWGSAADLTAGVLAVVLSQFVPYKLHIVLASLIPSGIAAWFYLKQEKKQGRTPAEPETADEAETCGVMEEEGGSSL